MHPTLVDRGVHHVYVFVQCCTSDFGWKIALSAFKIQKKSRGAAPHPVGEARKALAFQKWRFGHCASAMDLCTHHCYIGLRRAEGVAVS